MMLENTTNSKESTTIRPVMTTIAARKVAHTRMGIANFFPPHTPLAETMDTDV